MAADKRKDIARDLARRYGTLTPAELDQLTAIITPVKLTRGQLAVQYGDICRNIYYVQRGLVRQVYVKNGKECTEHISYEGGIVMCIESLSTKHLPLWQWKHLSLRPSMPFPIRNTWNWHR